MQHVLFHHAASPRLAARLTALGAAGLEVTVVPPERPELLGPVLAETEVLWHVLAPATAELIAAAPRLRLIQKIGVGVNTIDLAAAQARGIPVCNMPGTNTAAVAEHTLLLMLASLRRLRDLDAATRKGEGWRLPDALFDSVGEIGGRRVGLVGLGAVGRSLVPVPPA